MSDDRCVDCGQQPDWCHCPTSYGEPAVDEPVSCGEVRRIIAGIRERLRKVAM